MIFLIEYDRAHQNLVKFKKFKNSENLEAKKIRLDLELDLNRRKINHEIVLLQASSEALLRKTHSRYFESIEQIRSHASAAIRKNNH